MSTFTSTRYYEREWRDSTPSRHFGASRLLDDPFFRRMPFSGSLESLRTAGVSGTGTTNERHNYSSTSTPKSEEKMFADERTRFMVMLDVSYFNPEEITVKVANEMLVIEASHDEKRDEHGFVTRSLKRRYPLPKDVDAQGIVSELTKNGLLTVRAPKIDVQQRMKEREVHIQVVPGGPSKPILKK